MTQCYYFQRVPMTLNVTTLRVPMTLNVPTLRVPMIQCYCSQGYYDLMLLR
jgi:hypothetical protein